MSRWKKFKLYMFCLGAVLVGAGFLKQLIKIQEFKRKSRMTKDPMMLTHHPNCNFWLNAKCTCYVSWVRDTQKELEKYREQSKKLSENVTNFSFFQKLMNEKAILGWNWLPGEEELQIQFNNGTIIKLKIKDIKVIREGF